MIKLICPSCNDLSRNKLKKKEEKYICSNDLCKIEYPIINGIPYLISTTRSDFHNLIINSRGLDGKVY